MGDMADYALEEVMDEEDARTDYRLGYMSLEDVLYRGILNEFGGED